VKESRVQGPLKVERDVRNQLTTWCTCLCYMPAALKQVGNRYESLLYAKFKVYKQATLLLTP
jgi:hypothetical protein